MPFFKKNFWLILLISLAIVSRFLFLWYPAEVVFDEVHFGKFVSAYSTGRYYFDIHPPLGKLLIAGFAKLWGFSGGFDFEKIGEGYSAGTLFILRFLPALFGALLIPLAYKLTSLLTGSKRAGLFAGFLILLDNAFLAESKFILVDSMLFFFGLLALYLFVLSQKTDDLSKRSVAFLALAGLAFGAAISIKWTGLASGMMILLLIFLEVFRRRRFFSVSAAAGGFFRRAGRFLIKAAIIIAAAGLIYTAGFYVHFSLLPKSGPGDAFMTLEFQKTLQGNANQNGGLPAPNFWQKFAELNKVMYTSSAGLKATHPFSSRWYEWPLSRRPIYYWTRTAKDPSAEADIWLAGNPFSWLMALLTIALTLLSLLFKSGRRRFGDASFFLTATYLANLLPFIFVSRVAFLYHYLPSLAIGFILLAVNLDGFLNKKITLIVFWGIAALFFLALLPVSYGFPVPKFLDFSQTIINLFS